MKKYAAQLIFCLPGLWFFVGTLLLSACGSEDGSPSLAGDNWYQPGLATSWQLQLSGDVNTTYDVDVYDIDLFDAVDKIAGLHARGKKVICYFSAGSAENWRNDYTNFNAADMGDPLANWPGETWLDIRSDNVRAIMLARLDLAVTEQCDGVEPDNMDAYSNNNGLNLTAADQLAYNRFIAEAAHARDLAVGLKNDVEQLALLVDYFDFAVNESCFYYNECHNYNTFTDMGKPVFNVEYPEEDPSLLITANQQVLCQQAALLNFHTLMLPLYLDDAFRTSCY